MSVLVACTLIALVTAAILYFALGGGYTIPKQPRVSRVSTHLDDAGYIGGGWTGTKRIVVTLNGERCTHCLVADETEGYVETAKFDDNGNVYCIGKQLATQRKYGRVVISIEGVQ